MTIGSEPVKYDSTCAPLHLIITLLMGIALTIASVANAQMGPDKTTRLIISSAPGGGTDSIGRVLADSLSLVSGQQVVPENRAGASGIIASEMLVRAPADGSVLMIIQNSHAMNVAVYKKLPFDTLKDFTPVTTLAKSPLVLVASNSLDVKGIKDLIELGKKDPLTLNFASSEASARLAIQMISTSIKMPVTVATYKGTGPAVMDVAAGHVNYTITTIASTLSQKSAGRLNYLALMANERSSLLPDVPSLADLGFPDQEATGWWCILAPPNMSITLVNELNRQIRQSMEKPESMKRLKFLAVEPWMGSPEDFDRHIRQEVQKTITLAKQAGLQAE